MEVVSSVYMFQAMQFPVGYYFNFLLMPNIPELHVWKFLTNFRKRSSNGQIENNNNH